MSILSSTLTIFRFRSAANAAHRPAHSPTPASASVEAVLVAECGLCHDGSLDRAKHMIRAAAASGAHAVKFQKRSALKWFENDTPRPAGRTNFGPTEGLHRAALEFTPGEHAELRDLAHSLGLHYGVSVWDRESAFEIVQHVRPDFVKLGRPFARTAESPLVLRDLADYFPAEQLHVSCKTAGEAAAMRRLVPGITVYYCPGRYPDDDATVFAAQRVALLGADGISLHTRTLHHATAAVAVGAKFVEHHFALPGTKHADAAYSLSPAELAELAADLNYLSRCRRSARA